MSRKRRSQAGELYKEFDKRSHNRAVYNPAQDRFALIEQVLFSELAEMSMNRFTWTGLPDSVSQRFLEKTMFYNGLSVFFHHEPWDKYLSLRAASSGQWNYEDDPTSYIVTGNGMINRTLTIDECEPIWSNYLRLPDVTKVRLYASRLAELDLTIEINSKNARRNKVIAASETMRHSATQIDIQIQQGQPVLYLNAPMGEMVTALDLGIDPKMVTELSILRARLYGEAMTSLGIDNSNQDKKERQIVAEVEGNAEQVSAGVNVALNERQDACKRINKRFGLNLWVDINLGDDSDDADTDDLGELETVPATRELEA